MEVNAWFLVALTSSIKSQCLERSWSWMVLMLWFITEQFRPTMYLPVCLQAESSLFQRGYCASLQNQAGRNILWREEHEFIIAPEIYWTASSNKNATELSEKACNYAGISTFLETYKIKYDQNENHMSGKRKGIICVKQKSTPLFQPQSSCFSFHYDFQHLSKQAVQFWF